MCYSHLRHSECLSSDDWCRRHYHLTAAEAQASTLFISYWREGGWPLADSMPKKVSVFQTCFLSLTLAETHSVREQVNATNNCCTEIKTTYCFFGQYETESSCGEILHALYVMYPLFCED